MHADLTDAQTALIHEWIGEGEIIHDHSWPLQDTTVLRVRSSQGDFIIKASSTSHHIRREITAYQAGFDGLDGRVPQFVGGSARSNVLAIRYLPGDLVEGTPSESDPDTYRQAGEVLRRVHRPAGESRDYFRALMLKTRAWMNKTDGLVPEPQLAQLRDLVESLVPRPVDLVSTHGDYQPRNWIQHDGEIRVIDFGRAAPRPWVHDVVRLSHQQLLGQPALAWAFFEGVGRDIGEAEQDIWVAENLNQAVGTVVWAHDVGDSAFEEAGRAMVTRIL